MATLFSFTKPQSVDGTTTPSSGVSREVSTKGEAKVTVSESRVAPLGERTAERRFWFQRARAYDPDAIATLVRVSPIS